LSGLRCTCSIFTYPSINELRGSATVVLDSRNVRAREDIILSTALKQYPPQPRLYAPSPSGRGQGEGQTEPGTTLSIPRAPYIDLQTAIGYHHRQAEKVRCGQVANAPERGTSPAPVPEQSRRKLLSAVAAMGTAHIAAQVCWARPALPRRLCSHCRALPTATPQTACLPVPLKDGATLRDLAERHRDSESRIRQKVSPLLYLYVF
jgi:hypothetical protein